jgi:hypothetical protein
MLSQDYTNIIKDGLNSMVLTKLQDNVLFVVFLRLVEWDGGALSATPRHISHLLRLLPSRSDRVHKLLLRGDQKVTIEIFNRIVLSG